MPTLRVQPDVEVEVRPGETVLACLYRHGYAYRIGCRRGGCGVCKVDLVAGEVSYEATVADEVLPEAERTAGTCLTCRAVPIDDVTIALREETIRRNPMLAFLQRCVPPRTNPIPESVRKDNQ